MTFTWTLSYKIELYTGFRIVLQRVKLVQCHAALDATGYGDDIDMLLDGDEEEMADIVGAVQAIGVADKRLKGAVKKFMRELAKLRGQGETFS